MSKKFSFRRRRRGESRKTYKAAYDKVYNAHPENRIRHRTVNKKWRESPRGRALREAWKNSVKGKAYNRTYNRAYNASPAGRASDRARNSSPRRKAHKRMRARNSSPRRKAHKRMRARKLKPRYLYMMHRSRKLKKRGVHGCPMTLKMYREKLHYADGRERSCQYCCGENNKAGIGLDRINNDIGYTAKNTVPCCRGCNSWKGTHHTYEETMVHFKPMRDAARAARRQHGVHKQRKV